MPPHVIVIGSCNMDLVSRVDRIPVAGEHRLASSFDSFLGGKGANQAVAVARSGAQTSMIGRVGMDAFGAEIVATLLAEDIDVNGIGRDRDAPTGNASIWLDATGENRIVVFGGANQQLRPDDFAQYLRFGPDVLLLLQLEVPLPCVEFAVRRAHAEGSIVVLNAAPARPIDRELFPLLDVLVVNATEATSLAGDGDPGECARRLVALGVGACVVTLGGAGSLVFVRGQADVVKVRPYRPKAVVDTTGAGDAFCGAMAARLLEDGLLEAVRVGNAAGSLAVETLGAIPSMPLRSAIRARLLSPLD